ncbi:MAG TPA: hypothetical protein VNZ45_11485 [Bacteroidia bacterium]|jgi:hypothetical protein|nr:hypothetical protein [Bacteroidia bacterium]
MSAAEINGIKLSLIGWINQLSDTELITFLDGIRISKAKNDWWDELSDKQKKHVLAGIKDADKGKLSSSKEFWNKFMAF